MENILEKFKNKKVLVIGDVMIDEYIFGKVERISPEAPVPVVEAKETTVKAGGAANVALNIKSLGAEPFILGVVGKDDNGKKFKKLLEKSGVNTQYLIEDEKRPTTVKTRIVSGAQQLIRVDWESKEYISGGSLEKIIETVHKKSSDFDGIIISDYGKGVITEELFELTKKIKNSGKIITIDPKERNYHIYKKVTSITPNMKETYQAVGILPDTDEKAEKAGKLLIEKFKLDFALITRSEKGISLIEKEKNYHIKAKARQVYDVTGAGDTVIATFTLGLSSGLNPKVAAEIANIAGSIVVGKLGTATVKPEEILEFIKEEKGA